MANKALDKKFKESKDAFAKMGEHTKIIKARIDGADLDNMSEEQLDKYFEEIGELTLESTRLSDETIRISRELTDLMKQERSNAKS